MHGEVEPVTSISLKIAPCCTNPLAGDIFLADRGFDIRDSVGFYHAEVKLPP